MILKMDGDKYSYETVTVRATNKPYILPTEPVAERV
jgi:hypothetical protein